VHRAVQVAVDSIPRAFGLDGRQVQVVAVGAESAAAGTGTLNAALKSRFNPGPGVCGGFDAGDRVVVSVPLQAWGLLGGETGTVRAADARGLTVDWDAPHAITSEAEGARGVGGTDGGQREDEDEVKGADDAEEVSKAESAQDAVEVRGANGARGAEDAHGTESARGTGDAHATVSAQNAADVRGAESAQDAADTHGAESARGPEVVLGVDEVRSLRHAWALTIAEAQGGQWPAVVAVFDGESAPKLSRALVLGAVTLATQHLTVVHGAGRALAEAVENIPDRPRRTRLRHALRE
jgi:hypothetical protein